MHDGPRGGVDAPVSWYAHESGTTCRLLTAVLAAGSGLFRMHGVERLHQRPIGELGTALRELGCGIVYEEKENYPPLIIQARGLASERPVTIGMDESSQYLSGLLLAAPLAHSSLTFTIGGSKVVSWPYVGLTLQCLNDFGIPFVTETRAGEGAPWTETDWHGLTQIPRTLPYNGQSGSVPSGLVPCGGRLVQRLLSRGCRGSRQTGSARDGTQCHVPPGRQGPS